MADHAWCRDIARDAAVRAAEDNRTGPLPTLEEAIAMIPKSGSATSVVEQENKGVRMTKSDRQAAAYRAEAITRPFTEPAKCSPAVSKTGEPQSGMRTERVTLEFKIERGSPPSEWPWLYLLSRSDALKMRPGESVRVVDEAHFDDLAQVAMERDAAIRERDAASLERDEFRRSFHWSEESGTRLLAERNASLDDADGLRDRVADLESQLESVADRAAAAETALEARTSTSGEGSCAAPAATGGGEQSVRDGTFGAAAGDSGQIGRLEAASGGGEGEPVAYFVKWADKDWGVQDQTFRTLERAQDYIKDEKSEDENPQIVPLYRQPPQPRWWLTEEERLALAAARTILDGGGRTNIGVTIDALLARSTPPEVVLRSWSETNYANRLMSAEEVIAAIAAIGVAVKEVGRE
jgi:hypothetical protein